MGRKRKPTALHAHEGTLNVTRHRNRELGQGKPDFDNLPSTEEGWRQWVSACDWVTSSDATAAAEWAFLRQRMDESRHDQAAYLKWFTAWSKLSSSMGLTPTDRERLRATDQKQQKTKLAALLHDGKPKLVS